MTEKSQVILEEALKLTANERAEVAEQLIASLDEAPDADVERAWQEEVHRRVQEFRQRDCQDHPLGGGAATAQT